MFTLAAWSTKWLRPSPGGEARAKPVKAGGDAAGGFGTSAAELRALGFNDGAGGGVFTKDVPLPLPPAFKAELAQYQNARSASFEGWFGPGGRMLVTTKFGNTAQVHPPTFSVSFRRSVCPIPYPLSAPCVQRDCVPTFPTPSRRWPVSPVASCWDH